MSTHEDTAAVLEQAVAVSFGYTFANTAPGPAEAPAPSPPPRHQRILLRLAVPLAMLASAMNWACMSVAKPG